MKIFKLSLIEPIEIFIVRAESEDKAMHLVLSKIDPSPEGSEITSLGDTPPHLSYRITKCEEDLTNIYKKSGKREILSHTVG